MENTNVMDKVNWDKIDEDSKRTQSTSKYDSNDKTLFLKVKQGIHKLRILPTGNKLDKIPYLQLSQHVVRLPNADGRIVPTFMLCWNFILDNINSKETVDEKKNDSILSYLMKMQKMTQIDLDKFQNHGCPFCKAFAYMDAMGVDKEVRNPLYPKNTWNWNVIWRHNGISGDGNIYIWGVTQTHFNALIQQIKQDKTQGVFTLDPDKGFDLTLQATGEGLQR